MRLELQSLGPEIVEIKLCSEIKNRSDRLMVVGLGKGTDQNDFMGIFFDKRGELK